MKMKLPGTGLIAVMSVTLLSAASMAQAATWTTGGGTFTSAQINGNVADGDDVTVDADTIFNIDATDTNKIVAITVDVTKTLTVNFNGAGTIKLTDGSNDVDVAITVNGNMMVTGTGGGYFDYSMNDNQTLTIAGTIGGTDSGNNFVIGNNTLKTQTATVALNDVSIGGASAKLDVDVATSIDTLTVTGGNDVDVDIATGLTLTVDDATSISGASVLELIAVSGGGTETLAFTSGLNLGGTSQLKFTNDTGAVTGTVTIGADGRVIDVDGDSTIATLAVGSGNDVDVNIADNKTLTVSNAISLTGDSVFEVIANAGGNPDELDVTGGGITLGGTSQLKFTTDGGVVDGTVTAGAGTSVNVTGSASVTTGTVNLTGSATVTVANTKTLTATVDANANTLTLDGQGTVSTVLLDTSGGILNVDESCMITTLTQSAAATIDVANTKTLTATADLGAGNQLTMTGTGTISTVTLAGSDTLVVNADTGVTTLSVSAPGSTINVANGITWSKNVNIGTNNTTLGGTGTFADVDATVSGNTVTVTLGASGSPTLSDFDAGFDAGGDGVLIFAGTGNCTITSLSDLMEADDTIRMSGSGTLTVTSGINSHFVNGTNVAQILDINAGTVVIGAAGSNDDVTFEGDGDEITVANGATLTTFGSLTVANGGSANVNLDAAAGSTVNLRSAGGAETVTALADNDFQFLGTTNIDGSNGDYTLNGAFLFEFADVNINNTGSLIYTTNNGKVDFTPSSRVDLAGNGTLTLGSSVNGSEVVVDTIGDTGQFTIDRNSSSNLTLNQVSLTRVKYESSNGCPAESDNVSIANVDLGTSADNWTGVCSGSSGSGDTTTGGDMTGGDNMATGSADDSGNAEVGDDDVVVMVGGLTSGTQVNLTTSANGVKQLTVGSTEKPNLTVAVKGLATGSDIALTVGSDGQKNLTLTGVDNQKMVSLAVAGLGDESDIDVTVDENGDETVVLTDGMGAKALSLGVTGLGGGADIDVSINENGNRIVTLTDANGAKITLDLNDLPAGSNVQVDTDENGNVAVNVTDETGEQVDVTVDATNVGDDVMFTVTYNSSPSAKVVEGFPGFENEEVFGGSVTVDADGLMDDSIVTVMLTYEDADLSEVDEADIRVQKLNDESGEYEPISENDRGAVVATGVDGDYGVDTDNNLAWAVTSVLGTFAAGVPKAKTVQDGDGTDGGDTGGSGDGMGDGGSGDDGGSGGDDGGSGGDTGGGGDNASGDSTSGCGAGAAPCGAAGALCWLTMLAGLALMRRGNRRSWMQ